MKYILILLLIPSFSLAKVPKPKPKKVCPKGFICWPKEIKK